MRAIDRSIEQAFNQNNNKATALLRTLILLSTCVFDGRYRCASGLSAYFLLSVFMMTVADNPSSMSLSTSTLHSARFSLLISMSVGASSKPETETMNG